MKDTISIAHIFIPHPPSFFFFFPGLVLVLSQPFSPDFNLLPIYSLSPPPKGRNHCACKRCSLRERGEKEGWGGRERGPQSQGGRYVGMLVWCGVVWLGHTRIYTSSSSSSSSPRFNLHALHYKPPPPKNAPCHA